VVFDFSRISGVNAVMTLLLFVIGGAILLGHARKLTHDVLVQTAKDWQDLATSRLAIIDGLQQQMDGIQAQLTRHAERIATMEHDNQELQRLNQRLQVRMERLGAENEVLRELLKEAGIPLPLEARRERLRGAELALPEENPGEPGLRGESP
jgi:cell shape-determining protein MreC